MKQIMHYYLYILFWVLGEPCREAAEMHTYLTCNRDLFSNVTFVNGLGPNLLKRKELLDGWRWRWMCSRLHITRVKITLLEPQ